MVLYFAFLQFQCTLLTFAFIAFKSWPQNSGFIQTDSKLGDGKSQKSQYRSYLLWLSPALLVIQGWKTSQGQTLVIMPQSQ